MKYPIGPESLAKFYQVKVNVSDKIVREFRTKFPQTKPEPLHVNHDINVLNSNGMIPLVMIERPNDADRALEALQQGWMIGSASQKSTVNKSKRTNPNKLAKKPTKPTKAKQTNAKKPSQQKKQKPTRPLFVLPKLNRTEQSKKNEEGKIKTNNKPLI